MNQQTLTSEKDGCFLESSTTPKRCRSVVVFITNDISNAPPSDVKFVFSNAQPVDIRLFLDEKGEIHSSFRIIPKSQSSQNQPETVPIKNEISDKKKSSFTESEHTIQTQESDNESTESISKISRRGRPKGSKNKIKNQTLQNHKFKKEMFETNDEFKARVAEETEILNAQAA